MSLLTYIGMFAGGLVLLLFGGKMLVDAAVAVASRLGISPLLVGLTVVSWGTSAPELAFNTISAVKGRTDMVFGNLVGANICNIGLILGICALIRPLAVGDAVIRRELPVVALTMALLLALALFGAPGFARWEGLILLGVFLIYSTLTILDGIRAHPRTTQLDEQVSHKHERDFERSLLSSIVGFTIGLAMLGLGGSLAADGASGAATLMGISPAVVGLTVVAIGTTLPELITGIIAVRKGHVDIAVGNVVGSSIFNIACIFGLASAISPMVVPHNGILAICVMSGLCVVLMIMARTTNRSISRIEGTLLLLFYASFVGFQVFSATLAPPPAAPVHSEPAAAEPDAPPEPSPPAQTPVLTPQPPPDR